MSGKNAPSVLSVGPPSQALRPSKVFISYAHETEGRHMEAALRRALRERGCDVVSDRDLSLQNPSSLPAWMDDQIAGRVVLCVLTPDYLRAFEEVTAEGAAPRKGVRYELRAIRQRIYDHGERDGCPVIPVTSPQLDVELVPATLRALDISRLDFETGAGADQLLARIVALEGTGGSSAMDTMEQVPPTNSRRLFRQLAYNLEDDLPAEQAIQLVQECLRLAEDPELSTELSRVFTLLEEVIKDHGQVGLMRVLTDRCLQNLRTTEPRLRDERALEARVLISGAAWYLQRDHRLHEALDEAQKGIQLAEQYEDRRTAAYGRQSVGRIQRLLAEDAHGSQREHHLSASSRSLGEATALFSAIDGPGVRRRSEVGACLSLSARTQLSRYRLLGDRAALTHADELAGQAAELLTSSQQKKDRHDLGILRAEIAGEKKRYPESFGLLADVIESLISERGAPYSEILARAYAARARVKLMSRGARSEIPLGILADLKKAREIFQSQGLAHAAACCSWMMLTAYSWSVSPLKISRLDLKELEELCVDPRIRLAAIALLEHQAVPRVGNHPAGRRVFWQNLIDQVQRTD